MFDLEFDPVIGDLALVSGRLQRVVGDALTAQRIRIMCRTQVGLWPYDLSFGLPWRQRILVKVPDLGVVASAIRAQLLRLQGVQRVGAVTLSTDSGVLVGRILVNNAIEVTL